MPDIKVSVKQLFGFDSNLEVPAYSQPGEHVPDIDEDYLFNRETTLAILAGFAYNRRVMVTGYHGTGKSTHIEQVAARLNWPCIRINLDSHISRIDLIGKDAIVLKDGKQITEFREGILPWAYQHNVALVFDEYDAGRPDVMFVIFNRYGKLLKRASHHMMDRMSRIYKSLEETFDGLKVVIAFNGGAMVMKALGDVMDAAVSESFTSEVRALAQRSAQAAKETAAKIEGAITKTGQGVSLSCQVAQTLNEIQAKARQVDELVAEVSSASREQTQGITQINQAVGQMDKVTQQNAALVEQAAAAAESMKDQAGELNQSVSIFRV